MELNRFLGTVPCPVDYTCNSDHDGPRSGILEDIVTGLRLGKSHVDHLKKFVARSADAETEAGDLRQDLLNRARESKRLLKEYRDSKRQAGMTTAAVVHEQWEIYDDHEMTLLGVGRISCEVRPEPRARRVPQGIATDSYRRHRGLS